jgi:hypothetical protein
MDNIHIVNLSKYTSPEIVEVKNKDWVQYGEDNNYFQYLIDRYQGSTTNNAIINGMSKMIYGKGLDATDSNRKPDQYAQMKSLISKDCLKSAVMDRKMLGMAALQVTYDKGLVKKVTHFPMQTLRAEKCNEDGEVEAWYYHPDWAKMKPSDQPKRIPAFGFGDKKGNELFIVSSYVTGSYYYSPVDYQGALPYAVLEEEIADYLINDTINGFSGTKVVNFNNGVPDKEKQQQVKSDVLNKLTGSRGEKVIVAFNNNAESKTTIDDIPLNDAPAHYEYLSDEAFRKLIVGHRVTSPMLLGVRDGNSGLGNNADEIKTATLLFDNLTIKTYQEEFTDAIEDILALNNISLNLYFKTIQPLEFTDTTGMDAETKEEETGVKMSVHCSAESKEADNEIAQALIDLGEDEDLENWELISSEEVDYEAEELEDQEDEAKEPSLLSKIWNFVSTGTAKPNSKSKQDKVVDGVPYRVRYRYSPLQAGANSREFCKKMVQYDKLYRKEDIIAMGNRAVNAGWGANGADTYSIWKYKGGGSCHHKWLRQTFKGKTEGNLANQDPNISTNKARKDGFNPVNEKEVSMKPKDMPNQGFLPTNKRFQ